MGRPNPFMKNKKVVLVGLSNRHFAQSFFIGSDSTLLFLFLKLPQ